MTDLTLARIRMNPHHPGARQCLRSMNDMHRTIMKLVPDGLGDEARSKANLLYRVDTSDQPTVFIQSTEQLRVGEIPPKWGTVETRSLTPMLQVIDKGMRVAYHATLNPTEHVKVTTRKGRVKSVRKAMPPGKDRQWWHNRARRAGLDLDTCEYHKPTWPPLQRNHDRNRGELKLVEFTGTAVITDPDALTSAIINGIGRGKAYGAGLLTLKPA
ncbi:type I-E CRISPR-associated protein Cas6/Cse3/CasE [Haloglycomyces albus]|uniref:type I-E CRISPR-associated protein Cas6/Cse3/CasE n=1 Tax=Haloglycomyces albus TaxID=526067 RepID=UPI0004A4B551|nr:type I-E CRISPR-associated protein Cas6/Cse3/CasE [Haloglycomyces albus]